MIQISTEMGIATIVALAGCITFLFRQVMLSKDETIRAKDETISWLRDQVNTSLRTTERATVASEKATDIAKEAKHR